MSWAFHNRFPRSCRGWARSASKLGLEALDFQTSAGLRSQFASTPRSFGGRWVEDGNVVRDREVFVATHCRCKEPQTSAAIGRLSQCMKNLSRSNKRLWVRCAHPVDCCIDISVGNLGALADDHRRYSYSGPVRQARHFTLTMTDSGLTSNPDFFDRKCSEGLTTHCAKAPSHENCLHTAALHEHLKNIGL